MKRIQPTKMSSALEGSAIERKISSLEARLKAGNEARQSDTFPTDLNTVFKCSKPPQMSNRPRQLLDGGSPLPPRHEGTPTISRKALALPFFPAPNRHQESSEIDNKMKEIMKMNGILNISGTKYQTEVKDLDHLGELGYGTCGHVVKMLHRPSNTIIAVKQMRRSGNSEENKRIIMDIDVVLKSHDCPFIVQCLGCFITNADVWICMELMATCFDKLQRRVRKPIPEDILGVVTVSTVKALHYLKENHGVIHRDVKPSNILLDEKGNVKLCDFGISGRLVDSKAKTRSAGCAGYMAPERIDPPDPTKPDYDIRADVWSLGITLVELATGRFPYQGCETDFEVLAKVLEEDPPRLPKDPEFGPEFTQFVSSCLTKNYRHRPKYRKLLEHSFIRKYESMQVDVASWFAQVMKQSEVQLPPSTVNASTNTPSTLPAAPSPLRRFTPPPVGLSQASPTPPRRHGTFNHSGLQLSNHQRHSSVPEPLPLPLLSRAHQEYQVFARSSVEGRLQESLPPPPPPPPQRSFPVEHRKRHPTEPPHPPPATNGSTFVYDRRYMSMSPPPMTSLGRPTSPLVRQETEHKVEDPGGQKRFASHLNFQLQRRPPAPLPTQNYPPQTYPPAPTSPALFRLNPNPNNTDRFFVDAPQPPYYSPGQRYDPLTVPPSPPPRLSRGQQSESSSSPRLLRRGFLDPTRRSLGNQESSCVSPSLSRRFISPTPPQPPPRRLSESSSVPGSPQHIRSVPNTTATPLLRARYHYTPEPQRRVYGPTPGDVVDL